MQALVGKTGKEGLKRRVLQCDPTQVSLATAKRAKELLKEFDLEQVRDVSAGGGRLLCLGKIMNIYSQGRWDINMQGPHPLKYMTNCTFHCISSVLKDLCHNRWDRGHSETERRGNWACRTFRRSQETQARATVWYPYHHNIICAQRYKYS